PPHQVALFKMLQHEFLRFLPKPGSDFRMDAGIPNDGEPVVVGSHINQYPIPQGRFIHTQSMEIYSRPIHRLTLASGLNGQAYFARGISLRYLDGMDDFFLLLFGELLHT